MTDTPIPDGRTTRRAVLAATGATLTGLGGCAALGGDSVNGPTNGGDLPRDTSPDDGYPPEFQNTPEKRSVNTDAFETTKIDGTAVPLAPIEDVYYWYARGEARFADARGESSFRDSHIFGAVLSPAPDGGEQESDPVKRWPRGDRIVCYCSCPHHLSSMRAASLISNGYESVYVIDEGFRDWHDRNYPVAGKQAESLPPVRVIEGRTNPAFVGETAWAHHLFSDQREATPIRDGGWYRLELPFADVTDSSMVAVRTPEYRVEAPLGELTDTVVTG